LTGYFLAVEKLCKSFPTGPKGWLHALTDVSFGVHRGEVLGLVGESGSGKSTIGQTIMRLTDPSSGSIRLDGVEIATLSAARMRPMRRLMQIVFQDPSSSLNPRLRVGDAIAEPLIIHRLSASRRQRTERVAELLDLVGLRPDHAHRYPHEFSGGQRQRIGLARALAAEPKLLIADEPVSALDVSVQAQVIELIEHLKARLGLTLLIISHDMAVIEYISDRVVVLYLGRVMEIGPVRALFRTPRHPYTEALLSAAPSLRPDPHRPRIILEGEPPSPLAPPSGCVFRTRCRYALAACAQTVPALRQVGTEHFTGCIRDDIHGDARLV